MKKFFSFLSGFLTGAVVAAILGLLFAPEPGESLQGSIKEIVVKTKTEIDEAAAKKRAELEAELAKLRKGE